MTIDISLMGDLHTCVTVSRRSRRLLGGNKCPRLVINARKPRQVRPVHQLHQPHRSLHGPRLVPARRQPRGVPAAAATVGSGACSGCRPARPYRDHVLDHETKPQSGAGLLS